MYGGADPYVYGLKYQGRCIAAQLGEIERHRFFVGTTSLREENEIHLIEFNDVSNEITCEKVFNHPEEVWALAPHPTRKRDLFTLHNAGERFCASLLRIEESKDEDDTVGRFEEVLTLPTASDHLLGLLWKPPADRNRPGIAELVSEMSDDEGEAVGGASSGGDGDGGDGGDGEGGEAEGEGEAAAAAGAGGDDGGLGDDTDDVDAVLTYDATGWQLWDLTAEAVAVGRGSVGERERLTTVAWDSIQRHTQIAAAVDCDMRGWDLRSMESTWCIPQAHLDRVRSLAFNHNLQYTIVSGGDDSKVKFWDVRKPLTPVKVLSGHSHWVTSVQFNYAYDQLLLSSGTDGAVNLWRVSSISSKPLLELEFEESERSAADTLVRSYTHHEDSVYSIAWSACDLWVFASLSYDGKVVVNSVPSEEKYRLLL
eukprot:PLAT1279.2.p1 GENE.PLAT1279.2~~PLAT1279.2.p1  ORF type:complete len:445 (-),score=126.80 PLAT1279.2:69-1343(-)